MFEQHSADGRVLMTPGATMLGNPTGCFECSHSHSAGDRCVAFWFSEEYFGRMLGDTKRRGWPDRFGVAALPPLAATAALVAQSARALATRDQTPWDEIAASAAANTFRLTHQSPWTPSPVSSRAESSIAEAIQIIEAAPEAATSLDAMAQRAAMSPYHFLRVFNAASGLTPHQYVRRARLRRAAGRLLAERTPIIDIALGSGFGDVSNFNRSFRAEFGVSPRTFRRSG
jgi:AraC-like DNA-binding protein